MTHDQPGTPDPGAAIADLLRDLVGEPSALSETELRHRLETAASLGRRIDAVKAALAAEAAARSRQHDGHGGWAAREGHRNAESLVRDICGSSYREAAALVRVGELMTSPAGLGPVAEGVREGRIDVDAADGIVRALAPVAEKADKVAFVSAAATLARESESSHADAVTRMAKSVRDTLDRAGVAEREHQLREKRFLTVGPEIDGLRRLSGLLDPESAAIVISAVDAVTAPRRGGPRFVDPQQQARAHAIVDDERTHGQLVLDSVVEMIRIAGEADRGRVFGTTRPAVRVTISLDDLRDDARGMGDGAAHVESSAEPLSAATAPAISLRHRRASDRLRRAQRDSRRRPHRALLHALSAGGPRSSRWRMPLAGLRPSAVVDGGSSHRSVVHGRPHRSG